MFRGALIHISILSCCLTFVNCSRSAISVSPARGGVNSGTDVDPDNGQLFPQAPSPTPTPSPGGGTNPVSLVPIPQTLQELPFGGPYEQGGQTLPIDPGIFQPPASTAMVAISFYPGFSFGEKQVGTDTVQTFVIANFGRAAAIGVTVDFLSAHDGFTISQNNCAIALAGLTSCSIQVKFSPSSTGDKTATLRAQYAQLNTGALGLALRPITGKGLPLPSVIEGNRYHTCAAVNGAVKCWGDNYYGELGNGNRTNSSSPVQVSGITEGATDVASSVYSSCAVVNGGLKCWGYNGYGELGNGGNSSFTTAPVDVVGMGPNSGVTRVVGFHHGMCAIQNGAVKCWGYNGYGELGNGSTANSDVPTQVSGLTEGVTEISGSYIHVCAIKDGKGYCWGYNGYGQLGNGGTSNSSAPVQVTGLTADVISISAGVYHSCGVTEVGKAYCWGHNNSYSALGDNGTTNSSVPVQVYGIGANATKISAGQYFSCALVGNDTKCWGYNGYGQLGQGNTTTSSVPVTVPNLGFVATTISAGWDHVCYGNGNSIKCAGLNNYGQLGDNSTTNRSTPMSIYPGF